MIRSRVFFAVSFLFLFITFITYTFVDFREREDKAYELYQSESYLKILGLYQEKEIPSSELELTILSETISQLEKKLNEKETTKELQSFFQTRPGTKLVEWETTRGTYYHIEDPYLSNLKNMEMVTKELSSQRLSQLPNQFPNQKSQTYF